MSNVREILDQRREFDDHSPCPACGSLSMHHNVRYTMKRHMRDADGRLTYDVTTLGECDPHLIVTCHGCGVEWEMETYL